jgi:cell division protein FtsI (penicillin-binding protein 3)
MKGSLFLLENAGLRVKFQGRGSVRSQSIQAGTKVAPGKYVFLEMSLG